MSFVADVYTAVTTTGLTCHIIAHLQELYHMFLRERCQRDGLGTSEEVLSRQFRLHLHRGISYLATPHAIKSMADLIRLATGEEPLPAPAGE